MNFFGHAAAARLVSDAPAFLVGAMAPDLLPLCRAVASAPAAPEVAAGEAHHRAVDAVFHANPAFTALQAWASGALARLGVGRGPARASAHVGIELFLDGALARDERARRAYARALDGAQTAGAPLFVWADAASGERWRALIERLRGGTVPDAYRDPDFVADRLVGALARRPRLALDAAGAAILRGFLPELGARVTAQAGALAGALV